MAWHDDCKGCPYLCGTEGNTRSCGYLSITGNPRGCPTGKDCTRRNEPVPQNAMAYGDDTELQLRNIRLARLAKERDDQRRARHFAELTDKRNLTALRMEVRHAK